MRLVLAFVFLASPAIGGVPDWCLEAIEKGDEDGVARYAQSLLSRPFPFSEEDAKTGEQCLLHHTGKEYRYSQVAREFFLPENLAAGEAAALALAEEKKRAEAEKIAEEERARQEEIRRREEFLELAAAQKAIREANVARRLGEACERLYQEAPDETITNKLCFDYFWQAGLPE